MTKIEKKKKKCPQNNPMSRFLTDTIGAAVGLNEFTLILTSCFAVLR